MSVNTLSGAERKGTNDGDEAQREDGKQERDPSATCSKQK